MNIPQLFEQLIKGQALSAEQMQYVTQSAMTGTLNEIHMAAFLTLMRMKGETVDELTAAARTMQQHMLSIELGDNLIDIVGTGGDGKNTFNISTVSSFVAAAAGCRVAKHGNRASSSQSGSADLLLTAGFRLDLSTSALQTCMQRCDISFLFAQRFHPAMQHLRGVRQQLGIRTLFNLLGPLINPARVKKQVVGVYSRQWLEPIAHVLAELGSERVLVVHSQDGLDEISIAAPTHVVEYQAGVFNEWLINPKDYDCFHATLDEIIIETSAQSLTLAQSVLAGETGPARDIVLLNTAAALYCANSHLNFEAAIHQAALAIDSGRAKQRFEQLRDLSHMLEN